MFAAVARLACLLCAVMCLTACAPLLTIMGSSGPVVQIAATLDRVKLIGDGISYASSGKTLSDHALSRAAGADCRILNVVSPDPVCAVPGNAAAAAPAAPAETAAGETDPSPGLLVVAERLGRRRDGAAVELPGR